VPWEIKEANSMHGEFSPPNIGACVDARIWHGLAAAAHGCAAAGTETVKKVFLGPSSNRACDMTSSWCGGEAQGKWSHERFP
jgi:hypothetical protein